jgi:diguanylate cyclase (GGDEF)-like protein
VAEYERDRLLRAIEAAKADNNSEAVAELEQRLSGIPEPSALPEGYTPGARTAEIEAESDPIQFEPRVPSALERIAMSPSGPTAMLPGAGAPALVNKENMLPVGETVETAAEGGNTLRASVAAATSGALRSLVANPLASKEAAIERVNNFQETLFNRLPAPEQERVRSRLKERYGKEVDDIGKVPASTMRQILDENPDNENLLDEAAGAEWRGKRKQFWSRMGAYFAMGSMDPRMPGAQQSLQQLQETIDKDQLADIEYEPGQAPWYPGASDDARDWEYEADRNGPGIYEHIIMPALTSDEGVAPGQRVKDFTEDIIKKNYTAQQWEERKMPFFSPDVAIESPLDLFNADLWTDPDTKLPWNNLEAWFLTFMESAPEMAVTIGLTRGAGGLAARSATRANAGRTLAEVEKARQRAATAAGVFTGTVAEGYLVSQHVANETRETLMEVPLEKYAQDPTFQKMVAAGVTPEAARQMLAQESASQAAQASYVGTAVLGAPMSAIIGRSGAGALVQRQGRLTRGTLGFLGEGVTEGGQEVWEQMVSDWQVEKIDPDNPIFKDPNRYANAFIGGFTLGGPMGALAVTQPNVPAGFSESEAEVAKLTASYMEATNERFKYEVKITNPEYINKTAPVRRLENLEKLERLQEAEADALLKAEPKMRAHLEQRGDSTADAELKMLGRLTARANAVKTDIAVARSQRSTASQLMAEEKRVLQERAELQERVQTQAIRLEDIEAMAGAIETVQNQGEITENQESMLLEEGYAKRVGEDQRLIITPKGRRAMKDLMREGRQLRKNLEAGYTGAERRQQENITKRQLVDELGPAEREQMLYSDQLTDVQNRRAFNERQEHIDVRQGETQRTIEGAAPVVAAVDVDSLAWVNDNMSHSAGDRLLMQVADTLNAQEGVEVFRLGGDEFAVTGQSEEALEQAMQNAAKELADTPVVADNDEVTPQITWGKGATYAEADAQGAQMKQGRIARGVVAGRKKKPATYKVRSQQGLFQLDKDADLPGHWNQIQDKVQRGDVVEILTPSGATFGVVKARTRNRGRPRLYVNVQGRIFKFNPDRNWLIMDKFTDPADLAWITGDAEYAMPDRDTYPQTLSDVMIGHIGDSMGNWYADLDQDFLAEYQVPLPWYMNDNYIPRQIPYAPPKPVVATPEQVARAESVIGMLTTGYNNLPPINIVRSTAELEAEAPEVAAQIKAEAGGSFAGVRGYMDHINPNNGVYLFLPHIHRLAGDTYYEQYVAETVLHEVIGHYGVRGTFGNEAELRGFMNEIVDAFPRLANHYSAKLGLNKANPEHKQLLGEEMFAYVAGEVQSGKVRFNEQQKNLWQRIVSWIKDWLARRGWDRWSPVKKVVSITETKETFWNDERVQELLARSHDFTRNGPPFEWRALGGSKTYMRDGDIFKAGILQAIDTATETLSKTKRRQLAQQRNIPLEEIPKEQMLFPEQASPNVYIQAVMAAQKSGKISNLEAKLTGLTKESDWNFFEEATYGTLQRLHEKYIANNVSDRNWYKGVVPTWMENELNDIYAAMDNQYMVGPLPQYGDETARPVKSQPAIDAMHARIGELMSMKMDKKKTTLTKDLLRAHLKSENSFYVTVEQSGGHPNIGYEVAMQRLYGDMTQEEQDNLTEEQKQEIKDEVERSKLRGYDVGFDERQGRWYDWLSNASSYSGYSPQGSRWTSDYRVALIKTYGQGQEMATSGQHYDPNLMHIRTGEAQLMEYEDAPFIAAPNENQAGKALSLIELQSDQLQKNRKGFGSHKERDDAITEADGLTNTLYGQAKTFGLNVQADLVAGFNEMVKSIANMPDTAASPSRGRLMPALNQRGYEYFGERDWNNLTADQQGAVWQDEMRNQLDEVERKLKESHDKLVDYRDNTIEPMTTIGGTLDARTFQKLDAYAVKRAINGLVSDFNGLNDAIYSIRQSQNQKEFLDNLNREVPARFRRFAEAMDSGDTPLTRLPMTTYMLKPVMEIAYEAFGVDSKMLKSHMNALLERNRAVIRIPLSVVKDYDTARMGQSDSPSQLMRNVLHASFMMDNDLVPQKYSFLYHTEGDYLDVTVTADSDDILALSEKLPSMIDKYIAEWGPRGRKGELEKQLRRSRSSGSGNRNDGHSYSDLVDYLGLEEEDTSSDQSNAMRDWDVQSYYMYEEYQRDEVESELLNEWESDIDWDTVEYGGESLSRDGSDYRERLVVDDDGDVDSSDAEEWLEEARAEYVRDEGPEAVQDQVYERIYEMWTENGPSALILGSLPTEWDADGDAVDHVGVQIIAKESGDAYDIYIDGEEVDYAYNLDEAKDKLDAAISAWYDDTDPPIQPPQGQPYAPVDPVPDPNEANAAQDAPEPNWEVVAGNISSTAKFIDQPPMEMTKAFERMVTLRKKIDSGEVAPGHPLSKDELWRPIALKYLIADAVRRGYGGIIWNNGLASSTRGGMGLSEVQQVDRFTWTKEVMQVRGEEQEVYVIRSPEGKPLVLSKDKMVPVLGLDATRQINMQEMGKIPIPDAAVRQEPGVENPLDNYLLSDTPQGTQAVYRRSNSEFVGFARDSDQVGALIQQDLQHYGRNAIRDRGSDEDTIAPLGEKILAQGLVRSQDVGGALYIISGSTRTRSYRHTYAIPRLGGARQSYEDMTVRIWNKELKKYGARIEETYVKVKNPDKAYREEGQPGRITDDRDIKIAEDHGVLEVQELTGQTHGWVVMSQKKGPVVNDVFSDITYANEALDRYIKDNYGVGREGVKTFLIRVNAKMREEFSGPVAPFHYDAEKDPNLKELAKYVGKRTAKKSWRQRYAEMKHAARHSAIQGGLDRFYGLKRALMAAEVSDSSYIDARLSTSLDSLMKGVVEYGAPVWRDGVVANEGKSLAEVMAPIMDDPDTWGYFMVGRRAKRLLMEGWEAIKEDPALQTTYVEGLRKVLDRYEGATEADKVWNLLVDWDRQGGDTLPWIDQQAVVRPEDFADSDLSGLTDNEREYFLHILTTPHWRRPKPVDTRRKKKAEAYVDEDYGERWMLFDWRKKQKDRGKSEFWGKDTIDRKWAFQIENMRKNFGFESDEQASAALNKLTDLALRKQEEHTQRANDLAYSRKPLNAMVQKFAHTIVEKGREKTFRPAGIEAAIRLGDKFPHFHRVAAEYAAFNKAVLDFAEEAGVINPDTRKVWEHADYVPFYRLEDDRLIGGLNPRNGIANQRSPIKRLRGKEDTGIGDVINNIFINTTKLVDTAVKNNAAKNAVDALRGSGLVSKAPYKVSSELIPNAQMRLVLKDWGIDPKNVPSEAFEGLRKMMAIHAPEGEGYVSILRDGKKEYYYTDDVLLYRSLSSINMKQFGNWINFFRGPKRLLTEWITIDPAFVIANLIRDTGSSFVVGKDFVPPILGALNGMGEALIGSDTIKAMVGSGAAFENGYTTGNDPNTTKRLLRRHAKKTGIANTVLDTPFKLYRAWRHVTTASENANRIAIYHAARRAGKSHKRALFEAKDLMDFSMGGDWPVVQFLIQTVPFMNARAQGNYRLARGARENPAGFALKGLMLGFASWLLYMKYREDERYEELEMWDKHAYYHWWIGDEHYRLPKPFEVGVIFSTIPEMFTEAYLSDAPDAEKELMKGFAHAFTETFSMSPIPQTAQPIVESLSNYNFFTGRPIVSFYEQKRLPPEQYRYRTSPAMIELARVLPRGLDTHFGKVRSPLHLQNLYLGYTGTLGRYLLMAADAGVRSMKDYPLPPKWEDTDWPVWGRFIRGDAPTRRTKYETQVYELMDRVTAIQGSLNFLEKTNQIDRYLETQEQDLPYIRAASSLEKVREQIRDINTAIMHIHIDTEMDPAQKTEEINILEETRNKVFRQAYELRPGGEYNPTDAAPPTKEQVMQLIEEWGVDDSVAYRNMMDMVVPDTAKLLQLIHDDIGLTQLASVARAGGQGER